MMLKEVKIIKTETYKKKKVDAIFVSLVIKVQELS